MILSTPALYVNGEYNLEKENQSPFSQKNRRRSGNSRGNAPRAGAEKPAKRTSDKSAAPRGQKPRAQKPRSQKNRGEDKQRAADLKPAQSREKRAKAPKQPREGNVQAGKKAVKIVFLGGVGEIGKNMTAIECGDDIIIIDAGAIFPTEETPGFDLIVPDITYLIENRKKIRGLLLTHGHEDHIGGVPYLLKELKVPVIGTKLTLALVDNKLREHRINDAKEITVSPGQIVQLGCFKVRAVNVNHSIAGSLAFAIQTPQGVIFHSGDYKIDLTPVAGEPIDLKTISDFGASGVLLYMGESTNIERAGFTMSETVVGTTLDRLFGENLKRRLIVATFASNVHRLQQIIDLAVKYKRKVALSGRSMLNVVEAAEKIGEINVPDGAIVDVSKIKNMRDSEIVVVSTGSQGEPMSALSRMSNGENQFVTVGENDTVIISASPIPGNEKLVYRVINNLYKLGAEVVYESLQNIHVSGHACREEHKIMHHLLKPKFFIPVHGEYRHLKKHAQLAEELGMSSGRIIIPDIGNRVLLTTNGMKLGESVPSGSRLIDGEGIEEEKASTVIEDRRQLSEEGLFIVSVTVSGGVVLGEPAINSRGFVFDFHHDYDREIRSVINRAIDGYDLSLGTVDELKRTIKRSLANYLYKKTKQSPMIVPVVVEL
ncbi:MAG: ribonuclease J [Clostridia bacterium]|nr:ribonuclease J [Clostridia bacterium]MDE7214739.1 ribonuclease J [Clostridia bacterium]